MENGEQAIMGLNSLSPIESYQHNPNDLLTFISTQVVLPSNEPPGLNDSSIDFLNDVYWDKRGYVERRHKRRSGGTTLLCCIAAYYAIQGKNVVILHLNGHERGHFTRQFMELRINMLNLTFPHEKEICIEHLVEDETYIILNSIKSDIIRGSSYDIVILDPSLRIRDENLYEIKQHVRPPGKIIMNLPMY